ncbi:MAG: hypothetical protein ABR881_11340 [Candidatus Sulfotelmatobacter sp.]
MATLEERAQRDAAILASCSVAERPIYVLDLNAALDEPACCFADKAIFSVFGDRKVKSKFDGLRLRLGPHGLLSAFDLRGIHLKSFADSFTCAGR